MAAHNSDAATGSQWKDKEQGELETQDKLASRIDDLLSKGKMVIASHRPPPANVVPRATVDTGLFHEWRTQSLSFLTNLLGEGHVYVKNFHDRVEHSFVSHTQVGIGILTAVKEDVTGGYLTDIKVLISAEVFSDFLEMSEQLISSGYSHPAASLIGAVLEDGLRQIADRNGVDRKKSDGLFALNQKCCTAGIYNALTQKKVQVWTDIRNNADHGNFGEYTEQDVKDMHKGVADFLAQRLS